MNRKVNRNQVIMLYNCNTSAAKKLDNSLLKFKTTNTLQIFVLKETCQVGFAIDLRHSLIANIDLRRGWLTNTTKESPIKRTYPVTHRSILNEFLSNLEDYYNIQTSNYVPSQPPFTCSKLTIETLEQGVNYVQI